MGCGFTDAVLIGHVLSVGSGTNAREACVAEFSQLRHCKKQLGLKMHECYDSDTYKGNSALRSGSRCFQ